MGARRVDCRAAGREVVSWLSADQSSTPKNINEVSYISVMSFILCNSL